VPSAPFSGPELDWLDAVLGSVFEPRCGVGAACDAEVGPELDFALRRALRKERAVLRAMARLDGPLAVPTIGAAGEPVWPVGWVGSISHAEPYSVAVVARANFARSIGVDIEAERPVSQAFAERVCSASELAALCAVGPDGQQQAAVIFSVKEAVYKLRFPLSGEAWSLRRAEIRLNEGDFLATFHEAVAPFEQGFQLEGKWRRQGGVILAGTWLATGARGTP
jgi:4'-phosphopantetheinyl transferase EntD